VSWTIRRLALVIALLACLPLALPASAHAATNQLTGTAFFNPSPGTPCPEPPRPTTAILSLPGES